MKTIFALLFAFASATAWAAPDLTQKITLRAKNVTANEAIKEISTQTKVKFAVSPNVHFTKKLSIEVKEASLKEVLDFIAADQNVKWEAGEGNQINITTRGT